MPVKTIKQMKAQKETMMNLFQQTLTLNNGSKYEGTIYISQLFDIKPIDGLVGGERQQARNQYKSFLLDVTNIITEQHSNYYNNITAVEMYLAMQKANDELQKSESSDLVKRVSNENMKEYKKFLEYNYGMIKEDFDYIEQHKEIKGEWAKRFEKYYQSIADENIQDSMQNYEYLKINKIDEFNVNNKSKNYFGVRKKEGPKVDDFDSGLSYAMTSSTRKCLGENQKNQDNNLDPSTIEELKNYDMDEFYNIPKGQSKDSINPKQFFTFEFKNGKFVSKETPSNFFSKLFFKIVQYFEKDKATTTNDNIERGEQEFLATDTSLPKQVENDESLTKQIEKGKELYGEQNKKALENIEANVKLHKDLGELTSQEKSDELSKAHTKEEIVPQYTNSLGDID